MLRPRTFVTTFVLALVTVAVAGCVTHVTEFAPSSPCSPCAKAPCEPCSPCPTVVTRPCSPCGPVAAPMGEVMGDARLRAPTMFIPAGFMVFDEDGRYWVFKDPSEALDMFRDKGEPAKRVTKIGVGPQGRTLMSDDGAVIDEYIKALDPSVFELPPVEPAPEVVESEPVEMEEAVEEAVEEVVEEAADEMGEIIIEDEPEMPATE